MVLANKYKQIKNKMQQTQTTTSSNTATVTTPAKTSQKQYYNNSKNGSTSNAQTSVTPHPLEPARTQNSYQK